MSEQNAVVAIYASHVEAEEALEELQSGGIDEHAVGYYNAGDRMKYWQERRLLGGLWGLLLGSAFFRHPGRRTVACGRPWLRGWSERSKALSSWEV